jgi:hypothetical protein
MVQEKLVKASEETAGVDALKGAVSALMSIAAHDAHQVTWSRIHKLHQQRWRRMVCRTRPPAPLRANTDRAKHGSCSFLLLLVSLCGMLTSGA